MANRVAAPNLFAPSPPNWSLAQLDANAQNATGAINDSSLGSVNGPLSDTGSVNAYAVTCSYGSPSAYNNGMTVFFNPGNTNTGASTLTVSPLASLPIVSASGAALTGGEIVAGSTMGVVCDGSAFRIISQPVTPQIWSVRLRSFNAVGNPSFEVDQRNVGNAVSFPAGTSNQYVVDRWNFSKALATGALSAGQVASAAPGRVIPGTNFVISRTNFNITLTTAQASLAAGEYIQLLQLVEGPMLRELIGDVTSISVLAFCQQPITFTVRLSTTGTPYYTLTKLCQITTANQWTLFTLPNLPLWSASGTWPTAPGGQGYWLGIGLGSGSTYTSPANDTWQAGNFISGPGTTNFASLATGTVFSLAFIQHEPGSQCTTLIDKPFAQNYDECLRYYQKSWPYGTAVGSAGLGGSNATFLANSATSAAGWAGFPKPMAKTPTVTPYNGSTGVNNAAYDLFTAAQIASVTASDIIDKGFTRIAAPSGFTVNHNYGVHYTADTGW